MQNREFILLDQHERDDKNYSLGVTGSNEDGYHPFETVNWSLRKEPGRFLRASHPIKCHQEIQVKEEICKQTAFICSKGGNLMDLTIIKAWKECLFILRLTHMQPICNIHWETCYPALFSFVVQPYIVSPFNIT